MEGYQSKYEGIGQFARVLDMFEIRGMGQRKQCVKRPRQQAGRRKDGRYEVGLRLPG